MLSQQAGASLRLEGVCYRYAASETVLDNLTFALQGGEFVAVLGPSGCGKSTLIRLMAALEASQAGTVQLQPPDASLGVVFQEPRLLPWRSVLANVRLPLELQKPGGALGAEELALAAVRKVGLADAVAKYPRELSGGMKMRVAVARALVSRPDLLLLDEPFAALDEHSRQGLQDDLRGLWERQPMTVVLVTHSLPEAVFLANRVVILSERPATIIHDEVVKLPRVRKASLRHEALFHAELRRLTALVPDKAQARA